MPPSPELWNLQAEAWNAIAAWITAIVSIGIGVAGAYALSSWRKQVERDHFIDVARNLVRTSVELKFEIARFRRQSLDLLGWQIPSQKAPVLIELHNRSKPLRLAYAAFEVAYSEARVLLNDESLRPAKHLLEVRNQLYESLELLRRYHHPKEEIARWIHQHSIFFILEISGQRDNMESEVERLRDIHATLLDEKDESEFVQLAGFIRSPSVSLNRDVLVSFVQNLEVVLTTLMSAGKEDIIERQVELYCNELIELLQVKSNKNKSQLAQRVKRQLRRQ